MALASPTLAALRPNAVVRRHTSWQTGRPASLTGSARARWLHEQLDHIEALCRTALPSDEGFRWTAQHATEGWLSSRSLQVKRRDLVASITSQWFECGSHYRSSHESAGLQLRTTVVYCAYPIPQRRRRIDPHGVYRFVGLGLATPLLLLSLRGLAFIAAHPSRSMLVDGVAGLLALLVAIVALTVTLWGLVGLVERCRRDTVLVTPSRALTRFELLLRRLREDEPSVVARAGEARSTRP